MKALLLAVAIALAGVPAGAAEEPAPAGPPPRPAAAGEPWTAAETAGLRADLDAILAGAATVRGAHVGLLAVETATGRVLYARAADDAFVPASTMKLVTASVALAKLGPDFAFTTAVGTLSPTRLVLIGGGDALLGAADLDAAAAAVAAAGIRPIAEVDADESLFAGPRYAPGWSWDDFPYDYAAPVSALSLERNVVHATIRPGERAGLAAGMALAPASGLNVENLVVTGEPGSEDAVDVQRQGATIVLTGSIPAGAADEQVDAAVPDPPGYALDVFLRALAAHGAGLAPDPATRTFTTDPLPPERIVWSRRSPSLAASLPEFLGSSDNLVGEMLLRALGVARSGAPGTAENGLASENDWLRSIGVDPGSVAVADGSGLSVYNRLSPRALVRVLQADWDGPNRDALIDALPVAGVSGTLAGRFKGTAAEGRVFAKTGTMKYTRALSGYVRPVRHGAITFSLMIDDWIGDDADLDAFRGRILSRLAGGPPEPGVRR